MLACCHGLINLGGKIMTGFNLIFCISLHFLTVSVCFLKMVFENVTFLFEGGKNGRVAKYMVPS